MKAMATAVAGAGDKPLPRIVICGGGIMGAATAYYLAAKGLAEGVTVVEREHPAAAASGKAGGFLALDWNDSSPVGPLARLSYALHRQLAVELGPEAVGYRAVHTLQVVGTEQPPAGRRRSRGSELIPDWVNGHVSRASELGDTSRTAQVHPYKLTNALLAAAQARGSRLVRGVVQGLQLREAEEGGGQRVTGVVVDGSVLPADVAVIAMGPWSGIARDWLVTRGSVGPSGAGGDATEAEAAASQGTAAIPGTPLLPGFSMSGQKAHSVVLRPERPLSDHMLFTDFKYADGRKVDPEVYPRPDGTVYVCGESQSLPVPPGGPADVTVDPQRVDNIRRVAGSLASCLAQAPLETSQACYLPTAPDGLPVIGPVPGCAGAVLATGHTCWGILNGPATGLVVAEMIAEGRATSCDVEAFSPSRFAAAGAGIAAAGRGKKERA